jgi:predicted nucleic acid-binding Zn ribbon protein
MCLGSCNGGDGCFMDCFKRGAEEKAESLTEPVRKVKTAEEKAKSNEAVRKLLQHRRDNDLCTRCGEPSDTGQRMCSVCKENVKRYEENRKLAVKEAGGVPCTECQRPNSDPTFNTCPDCRERQRAGHVVRKAEGKVKLHTPEQAQVYKKTRKQLEKVRLDAGQCVKCGEPAPFSMITCAACTERLRGYVEAREDAGLCVGCGLPNPDDTQTCKECMKNIASKQKQRNQEIKDEVFNAYGGYRCACCGEDEKEFLQLDHMNNDGAEHRRKVGAGIGVYKDLKARGFPPGFQVLCANCNWASFRNGGVCPHHKHKDPPPDISSDYHPVDISEWS